MANILVQATIGIQYRVIKHEVWSSVIQLCWSWEMKTEELNYALFPDFG